MEEGRAIGDLFRRSQGGEESAVGRRVGWCGGLPGHARGVTVEASFFASDSGGSAGSGGEGGWGFGPGNLSSGARGRFCGSGSCLGICP